MIDKKIVFLKMRRSKKKGNQSCSVKDRGFDGQRSRRCVGKNRKLFLICVPRIAVSVVKRIPPRIFPKNVRTSVVGEPILRNSFPQQVCWEFSPNLSLIFFFLLERPLQRSGNDTKNRRNQPYRTRCVVISFYIRQKNIAAYFSVEVNLKFLFYSKTFDEIKSY